MEEGIRSTRPLFFSSIVAERWWKLSTKWGLGRHVVGFMGSILVLRQEWLQVFEESFKTSLHVGFAKQELFDGDGQIDSISDYVSQDSERELLR